jgi:hypothetical protein
MAEATDDPVEQARHRLRLANGATLSAAEIDLLAPDLADLARLLGTMRERLSLEAEPATIQRLALPD